VRVTAIQDITERKEAQKRLEHQAFHDVVTDLPNRQLLLDRLGHALRRTRRRRGRRVAVLLMDLDNFKSVNDSFGHEVGDLLLVVVAERLKGCLRPEDTLARFGGDEFVVLLEDTDGLDEAVRVKERIAEVLKRPFVLEGRELYVSASIGIALGEDHTEIPKELLRKADTAMYEANAEATFGHRVFDPDMHERVLRRLGLENDLRRAIEQEEFRLYYQPKVRLKEEDSIVEVEALLRWEHPQRGLLLPEEFISPAEETGLILPLGRWVLREACRQVKEWQERYHMAPPLVACVNISANQLRYPHLLRDVGMALEDSGVEARSLVLEITESALVKDVPTSMTVLEELRALGVRFAVDDFGSEYSSLSYLMRLPVDFVKIDKSFVWALGEDPKAAVIVEAIISLAHSLGLEAVGEGVESIGQLVHLRRMGCDLAQGFYLFGAVPSEEFDQLLVTQLT
jgi:diguanylate cyclase (GGDEF)-like protein